MKKKLMLFCNFINIIMIVIILFVILSAVLNLEVLIDFFTSELFLDIRMIMVIPVFILWINNLVIWSKYDKSLGRFFMLFFLNGFYNPFYYRMVLKNKWQ